MMTKTYSNTQIAELLRSIAAVYQIKDEVKNKFRIVAYQRAADAIEHLSSEIKDIWDEGKLDDIPGVGKSITEHLDELFKKGHSKHFDELLSDMPKAMFKLMEVSGIGPKTAYKLAKEFNISDKDPVKELKKIAIEGKIAGLPGFGEEKQKDILQGLSEYKEGSKRTLLPVADSIAQKVIQWMKTSPYVLDIDPLGSLRRRASTIGDIDLAVATNHPSEVLEHFTKFPEKLRVIEKGEHTSSILVPGEIQVDLMVQPPDSYGSLLQHFTGSKHHNIALREYALKKKMSLSEYGIKVEGKLEKFRTEGAFYKRLGLPLIPPELREGTGEIQLKNIPQLIELKDIKGDLQIHSDFDIETSHDIGSSSMDEILKKAEELNYEYIAFTEHNPSQKGHNQNQIEKLLMKKSERVNKINNRAVKHSVKRVFNSLEIDILPSGALPVGDKALQVLDFALVSVHSSFRLSRQDQTRRVLEGLSHPKVKIFAHPTGRKLNFREGIEVDWEKIFDFCVKNNKFIEINAEPSRLDLPDFLIKDAKKAGVMFSTGTDSHNIDSLNNMKFGVYVARRGWLTKSDIITTFSLDQIEKLLLT